MMNIKRSLPRSTPIGTVLPLTCVEALSTNPFLLLGLQTEYAVNLPFALTHSLRQKKQALPLIGSVLASKIATTCPHMKVQKELLHLKLSVPH